MPPKATCLLLGAAIAVAAAACIDRALPGSGTLGGSTAGAPGGPGGGTGGGGGAASGGTDGAGGSATTGAGGTTTACPPLACPEIFCSWGYLFDEHGCQTCQCAPPRDCIDQDCGPRPAWTTGCPHATAACIARGDRCVWEVGECPCRDLGEPGACDKIGRCRWLIKACSEPTIPYTGCYDNDVVGCTSDCMAPRKCARVYVDGCSLETPIPVPGCADDAVCRDQAIAVCSSW